MACRRANDPEFGISRGRLLPDHRIFGPSEVAPETRQKLQDSLVLVHGGLAQNVGPILEMVTEKYLLRSEAEWLGRQEAWQHPRSGGGGAVRRRRAARRRGHHA